MTLEPVLVVLLATSFTCVGLLSLWAVWSPRHWFLRGRISRRAIAAASPPSLRTIRRVRFARHGRRVWRNSAEMVAPPAKKIRSGPRTKHASQPPLLALNFATADGSGGCTDANRHSNFRDIERAVVEPASSCHRPGLRLDDTHAASLACLAAPRVHCLARSA